jgi:hypothetical protein
MPERSLASAACRHGSVRGCLSIENGLLVEEQSHHFWTDDEGQGRSRRRHSYSLLIFYNLRDELLTTGNYDGSTGQERGKSRRSTIHITANNVRGSG